MIPGNGVVTPAGLIEVEDIATLINNRQNGRRRGRGGGAPRPNGGGNMGNERGNRIDNRSRGNASQLYEKYKTLARDAQTQGDRVMTEYYLQFADHYFRVLAETRPRFDEQQQQRRNHGDQFDDFEDGDGEADASGDDRDPRDQQQPQQREQPQHQRREQQQPRYEQREPREAREPREQREPRFEAAREERADGGFEQQQPRQEGEEQPRRRRGRSQYAEHRPNEAGNGGANGEAPRLEADRLPPAFARPSDPIEVAEPVNAAPEGNGEPAVARRPRRPRRPAGGDDTPVVVEA